MILLGKFVIPATGDPVVVDGDMIVPVFSRVFMPEPNNVAQLVDHNPELVAVLTNGNGLGTIPPLTNKRTTSESHKIR